MEKQADNFLNKNLGKILKENKMIKETYNIRGGVDANGNHIVKIIPTSGKERGFSIQTNGKLKQTNRFFRGTNEISDPQEIEIAKIEIAHYVNQFGSPRQKAIIMEGKKTLKEGAEIFKANYANRIALGKLQRIFTDYKFLDEEQTIVGNEARQIESLLEDLEEKDILEFNDWAIENGMDIREPGMGVVTIIPTNSLNEAIKVPKRYTIITNRRGRSSETSGTLEELIKYFSYTLEVGASWQHEKGNSKINRNPKNIMSLVNNINAATNNAAANGYSGTSYEFGGEAAPETQQLESKIIDKEINKKEIQESTVKKVLEFLKERKLLKESNVIEYSFDYKDGEGDTYSFDSKDFAETKAEIEKLKKKGYKIIQTWKHDEEGNYIGKF